MGGKKKDRGKEEVKENKRDSLTRETGDAEGVVPV